MSFLLTVINNLRVKRGKSVLIKFLTYFSPKLRNYFYHKNGYKYDICLNLSDNASIYIQSNEGTLPHELGLLKIFKLFSSSQKIFWDIGTNYGYYPWVFVNENLFKKVICFEPNVDVFSRLKKSFDLNEQVILNNVGLGEFNESRTLKFNKSNSHLGSFNNLKSFNQNYKTYIIPVYSIDYFRSIYGKPDILKIDVEGFEYDVLKGYKYLNSDYPILTLEWISNFQTIDFDELLSLFDKSWLYFYIGKNGHLYQIYDNEICSNDILFISTYNSCFYKIKELIICE
jgi:FkbM family methyltransferase